MWSRCPFGVDFEWRPMFPGAAAPSEPRPMRSQVSSRRDPRLRAAVLARCAR